MIKDRIFYLPINFWSPFQTNQIITNQKAISTMNIAGSNEEPPKNDDVPKENGRP